MFRGPCGSTRDRPRWSHAWCRWKRLPSERRPRPVPNAFHLDYRCRGMPRQGSTSKQEDRWLGQWLISDWQSYKKDPGIQKEIPDRERLFLTSCIKEGIAHCVEDLSRYWHTWRGRSWKHGALENAQNTRQAESWVINTPPHSNGRLKTSHSPPAAIFCRPAGASDSLYWHCLSYECELIVTVTNYLLLSLSEVMKLTRRLFGLPIVISSVVLQW